MMFRLRREALTRKKCISDKVSGPLWALSMERSQQKANFHKLHSFCCCSFYIHSDSIVFFSLSFSLFVRQKRFNGLSFLGPGNPLHQHLVSLSSLSCQTSVCLKIPSCALSSVRLSVWVSVPWWCLSPPPALIRSCGALVLSSTVVLLCSSAVVLWCSSAVEL